MAFRADGHLIHMFDEAASRKLMATFTLALFPLLAEAALTFIVCRGYLHRRPPGASIPTSIRSILLINVFLTLIFLCSTLVEGMIVSAKLFFEPPHDHSYNRQHLAVILAAATLTNNSSAIVESLQRQEQELDKQENKESGGSPLDLLAMAMVWMVVLAYVGVVASIGLHVGCRGGEMSEKSAWSMKAMRGMIRVLDRIKWEGLCLAVVLSTWGSFHILHAGISRSSLVGYGDEGRRQGNDVVAFLLEMTKSERVWRWSAASSTLILLAVVSFYTMAARLALYLCCKRFSLQHADAEPLLSSA